MKFKIRKVGKYLDIQLEVGNATHDLGFHTKEQAQELLDEIEEAVDEISLWILRRN